MSKGLIVGIFVEASLAILNLLLYIEDKNVANGVSFALCTLSSITLILLGIEK